MTMEKEECWATFLTSGKVTDYLSYRQAAEEATACGYGKTPEKMLPDGNTSGLDDRVKQNAGFY